MVKNLNQVSTVRFIMEQQMMALDSSIIDELLNKSSLSKGFDLYLILKHNKGRAWLSLVQVK